MHKRIYILVLAITVIFGTGSLWADVQKVDGSITYKTDRINPKDGEDFQLYGICSYITFGEKFGVGTDITLIPHNDYISVKPIATWSLGKGFSLVGGFSSDSEGKDHVQIGVWYAAKIGKLSIFLDPRYYFEASDEADGYFDGFLEASYPLSDKVTLGIDVVYDYWRNQEGSSWGLIGPVVSYKLTKPLKLFFRVAKESNFKDDSAVDFRLGMTWSF
jgi:hypothetical protein